jgi:hypothetical protein
LNTNAAVEQGVQAWAAALNAASVRANSAPLVAAATSRCTCVAGTEKSISYLQDHQLHLDTAYRVTRLVVTARTASSAVALVTIATPAYEALKLDGTVYRREPATSQTDHFSMKLTGAGWRVDTIY